MRHFNYGFEEALAMAQQRRPSIMPNPGFREQLQLYQRLGHVAPPDKSAAAAGDMERLPKLRGDVVPEVVDGAAKASCGPQSGGDAKASCASPGADMPIRMQFCSDMHLEMPLETKRFGQHLDECLKMCDDPGGGGEVDSGSANVLPRAGEARYLALLGDVFDGAKVLDGTYREFLMHQSVGFEAVFVLAGNHEFYRTEYNAGRAALASLCKEVTEALGGAPIVHFMDCARVDLPGTEVRILGCTLWSNVDDASSEVVARTLSDYNAIRVTGSEAQVAAKATVADTNAWHARELAWLESEIARATLDGRRCVVLTHHGPTFHGTCPPAHMGSAASAGFCTSLERLLRPPVTAWLFGHTHWSSWQRYRAATDGTDVGRWWTLSGGALGGGPSCAELMSPSSECDAQCAGDVLVASNQVGYGAKGEHRKSRCHPRMLLAISADGGRVALRCA